MHRVLVRQLRRAALDTSAAPDDLDKWLTFVQAVDRAYVQADDDRYLLERSLALSSEEMGELHAQLADERDTVSAVICSLIEGVCAIQRSGIILFINPEARRLLGLSPDDELVGQSLGELVDAKLIDGRSLMSLVCGDGIPQGARLIVGDDDSTHIKCITTPLGTLDGGLVIALRDETAQKRMESERVELNRQLVDASRRAGMAEVAAGVLHNVGNVLNSVNVSAAVAADTVRDSRAASLRKVAELLNRNRDDLSAFLQDDPSGRHVPEYVVALADRLEEEQEVVLRELRQLQSNIDHIREIVAMQQTVAKDRTVGIREPEDIAKLITDALRITEDSLTRHRVNVIRDLNPIRPVSVERHQLMQILVNLLSNAKKAVLGRSPEDREVTVRLVSDRDTVRIVVADNGVGIEPENLSCIFQHGFTTDDSGHGFGLHSSALAAKAMGGTLTAASAGPDRGAVFTLEIPAELADVGAAA